MHSKRYSLYIDESGDGNFRDRLPRHNLFILTGIILDQETDKSISAYFHFIKNKFGMSEKNHSTHLMFLKMKKQNYLFPIKRSWLNLCVNSLL